MQLDRLRDTARDNPEAAALLGASLMAGVSRSSYQALADRRAKNLVVAARSAEKEADSIANTVPNITKSNVTFTVGGTGASGADIAPKTARGQQPRGDRAIAGPLTTSHELVAFDPIDRATFLKDWSQDLRPTWAITLVRALAKRFPVPLQGRKEQSTRCDWRLNFMPMATRYIASQRARARSSHSYPSTSLPTTQADWWHEKPLNSCNG
jgi:hypothetical protein